MVYPEGLKSCLVLVITSLPKTLAHGANVLDDEPTFLQVDLSQFKTEERRSKVPIPGSDSTSTSPTCPTMAPPPQIESSQHDHGGPIMGSTGYLQSSIREFHPKKISIHGPRSPILS